MPRLTIQQPAMAPIEIAITQEELRLGRAEDNEIVLVADEVSRHHAKLCRRGAQRVLTDLNSLNGTFVNEQRIAERVLSDGDEIRFGAICRAVYHESDEERESHALHRPSTSVVESLDRIRAEMDRAASHLTLIGKRHEAPAIVEEKGGPQPSPEELVAMSLAYRRLDALYRAGKVIASDFDLARRLAAVLDTAIEVTEAERGFLMLSDEGTAELRVRVARAMGQDLQSSSPSMGIADRVARSGEPVLMADADQDSKFGARESIIRQHIRSAMCVPLQLEDRVLGAIYVDTQRLRREFAEEDLELFASMATQLAMAIENVRLYEQMLEAERRRANLGRFLSPAIVEEVMKEDTTLELGGRKRVVTTLFCDVRGFSTIAEKMPPGALVSMLNEHFTAMTQVVFENQGTLDKFIGDEVMAVFGAPLSAVDDATCAVRTALGMMKINNDLNARRALEGRPPFQLGIGLDTGEVIAGYVGSPERMEFTVVGDHVNTARRLCAAAAPGQVFVSDATYQLVREIVECNPVGSLTLKGKETQVVAYEVLALKQ